jgi:hypothetical protein
MPLVLKSVPAAQGLRWLRDGWRLFGRQPLAFSLMFASFFLAAMVVSAIPFVGIVAFAAGPLLSLGFMIASEAVLGGGNAGPKHFFAPFQRGDVRKRAQIKLCIAYGLGVLGVVFISHWFDDGRFTEMQRLILTQGQNTEVERIAGEPEFAEGMLMRMGLLLLLTIPFWHAPALVHWGAQGAKQALFSSTLAVWRAKGAFVVYSLAFAGLIALFVWLTGLAFGLLGLRGIGLTLLLPAAAIFSTVFYTSLIFTFNDSFGGASQALTEEP